MEEKVMEIASLIKEREMLLKLVGQTESTKEFTKIEIAGEDGTESNCLFYIGGVSDNNKENLALVKEVHDLISKNFESRLEVVNAKIAKLLK